jgi:hypothetical protein
MQLNYVPQAPRIPSATLVLGVSPTLYFNFIRNIMCRHVRSRHAIWVTLLFVLPQVKNGGVAAGLPLRQLRWRIRNERYIDQLFASPFAT